MSERANMITLDSCITDYLDESEQGIHKYKKCFNIAFRGMDELGLDFFYAIRSMKLPISATKTVALPPDYINYSKVGVLNANGEVVPLMYNDNLALFADNSPNRLSVNQDPDIDFFGGFNPKSPVFYNYWNDGLFTNLYGIPSGQPFTGQFKIDNANGLILLGDDFSSAYLILEYVSAPSDNQDYYIPIQFRESMIAYLWWRDSKAVATKRGQVGTPASLKSEFYNQRRLARARFKPVYLQQQYYLQSQTTRLTAKF